MLEISISLHNTNYAHNEDIKKRPGGRSIIAKMQCIHHISQDAKRQFEIDSVRWMLAVHKVSPDSPRFTYFYSRWRIPEKITAARACGTFDNSTAACTSFAPELCSFIQAGFDEYCRFVKLSAAEAAQYPLTPTPENAIDIHGAPPMIFFNQAIAG